MSVVLDGSAGITLPDNGALSTSVGDVIIIGSTGAVTTPYQPSFFAIPSQELTGLNTVYQKVLFQTAVHNIGNHYNASTALFTAPVAGSYQFNTNIRFDEASAANLIVRPYLNGVAIQGPYAISTVQGAYNTLVVIFVHYLQVNDTMSVYARAGDSSWHVDIQSSFSGYLLG